MSVRKLILLILAVLLAFTAIDAVNWYASPSAVTYTQTGNITELKGESFSDVIGLEPFQSIIYYLDKPLEKDTIAALTYYTEDYSSGRSEKHPLKDARQIVFQIPLNAYAGMDCYIDANVKIEKITVSDQPLNWVHIHYPIRPLKILIPSIILLAILLLFIYVKPLNIFIRFIDEKIIDPETRLKGVTVAYIVLAVAALLHHIYVTMYHKYVLTGYTDLGIPLLVFSIITFFFGKLWKDKVSWILLALLCLKYARTALEGQQVLNNTTYIYYMSIYAFFGCYGVARALSRKYWKPFFSALCAGWTLAALVLASIGIYVAIARVPVKNFGSEWFTISYGREYFIYQPVTAGTILSVCMFVAMLGCFLTKKKILQVFYILAALILYFAGSLTNSRVAYLLSALQIALMLYIFLRDKLKPGYPKNFALTTGKYILLLLCFLATAAVVAFVQMKAVNLIEVLKVRGGLFIQSAHAEDPTVIKELTQRDFKLDSGLEYFLSGRLSLWQNTLTVITQNPKNLLLGQSVYNPMRPIDALRNSLGLNILSHTHNTLIQNFLENGLPGFLLYLSFILIFIFHAVRIIRNKELPFWQRIIPVGTILCIAEGLIDNTCHVTYGYPQMTILYLFAGFTIALSRQAKKVDLSN